MSEQRIARNAHIPFHGDSFGREEYHAWRCTTTTYDKILLWSKSDIVGVKHRVAEYARWYGDRVTFQDRGVDTLQVTMKRG